ncbi:hypothetical protein M9458_054153 [Cirrhinus mrigala]|uniref:Uncharacterized protein n=1 Tax=Cirrhinus mrigala TaxID=683832 RepID=A0ABD0MK91_CIRMR
MAASMKTRQATAVMPEPRQVPSDLQEPRHVSADIPEPHHVSAILSKPCQVSSHRPSHAEPTLPSQMSTASTPSRPADIPLSTVLPVMAIAILSVWATHCAPEASSGHESAPEASSVHGSVPETFLANESAPIPPEVSACTVEPPKEVASMNELTDTPDHEFAPVPPEVQRGLS